MIPLRSFDLGLSALFALLGIYIAWQGATFGYQDGAVPAAGFFPVWIGAGLALFSVLNFVKVLRRSGLLGSVETMEVVRVGLVSLALVCFVLISELIGMLIASVPLMIAIGCVFGARDARSIISVSAISIGMATVLYLVFGVVLTIPLL
ncbi:tripartite tricarboxylate transporter TctB family protein [Agrobacterium tumefaciens]|uniref:tripartite tricarboxylate transporter TctB family protein n=1 Tax=Agrobacterium tumefaciens TaxID=358 RepID=UPI0015738E13|nr:tripartite tricarboxylate transporter TctB family protein [Agrobacterium tumefaciens]